MSGCSEFGKCEIYGELKNLKRTYFHYDIKCECHSPTHFKLIIHCSDCKPIGIEIKTITVRTSKLSKRTSNLEKK
jgi:hypothetical protein